MHDENHHHGLAHDLEVLGRMVSGRRRALRWLTVGSVTPLAVLGCGGGGGDSASTSSTTSASSSTSTSNTSTTTTTTTTGSCSNTASETNGPYPADGSNTLNGSTVNALTLSGIVR